MRCGTLCYATDSGLGILAKAFVDNGVVTDALVVRHGHHTTHDGWYPESSQLTDLRNNRQREMAKAFCLSVDVMLFFETPFLWELIPFCRDNGIRTVLMPMHECMPQELPYQPDRFICPSLLDLRCFPDRSVFIPVPVDVPWRLRTKAEVFVHNAGHGGLRGRNGTVELLEALPLLRSPAKIIIRSQSDLKRKNVFNRGPGLVELQHGTKPYSELWNEADVFVFSEKFNGLSLPLQEARAAGMLVMATDRFPMNEWLPREPLIPVSETHVSRVGPAYREFDEAVIDPVDIADKIDSWYGRDISDYSQTGKAWAESMSWANLKARYLEALS